MVLKTEGLSLRLADRTFWYSQAWKNKNIKLRMSDSKAVLPAAGGLLGVVAHAAVNAGVNCFKRFLKTQCLDIISVWSL